MLSVETASRPNGKHVSFAMDGVGLSVTETQIFSEVCEILLLRIPMTSKI